MDIQNVQTPNSGNGCGVSDNTNEVLPLDVCVSANKTHKWQVSGDAYGSHLPKGKRETSTSGKERVQRQKQLRNSSFADTVIYSFIKYTRSVFQLARQRVQVYVFVLMALGTFLVSSPFLFYQPFLSEYLLTKVVVMSVAVYLISLATYAYNDLTDHAVDKANKKDRLEKKDEKKDTELAADVTKPSYHSKLIAASSLFVAGVILSFVSLGTTAGIASAVFSVLGIAYSHPKIHLKDMFVVKTFVTAMGGAIISFIGILAATVPSASKYAIISGSEQFSESYLGLISTAMVFLFWFVLGPLGDVGDIKGDRIGKRKTIPIVIGIRPTFCLVIGAVLSIYLLILHAGVMLEDTIGVNMHMIGIISSTIVSGYVVFRLVEISKEYENKKKLKVARTSMRWGIFGLQFSLFLGALLGSIL